MSMLASNMHLEPVPIEYRFAAEFGMNKNDPISSIAIKRVISVQEGGRVSDARNIMSEYNIHHVPVVSDTRLVGMVSFTDMMKLNLVVAGEDDGTIDSVIDQQFTLDDIMTTDVITANMASTVREAAQILADNNFHSLPLVGQNGHLEGIVTSTDLLKYLCNE